MYMHQMIAQVPSTKPYSKRHLQSVKQMLRLINEVLTMAPEFGPAMAATPGRPSRSESPVAEMAEDRIATEAVHAPAEAPRSTLRMNSTMPSK